MKRDRLLIDLAQVDRHIERGEENVIRQRQIVARLIKNGRPELAREAAELLEKFKTLQDRHLDHRKRLLEELGK